VSRPEPPVLEITGLSAGYEDVRVLEEVSIQVGAGSVVAVIGPNGAGKSTLLKAVCGLAAVGAGRVVLRTGGRERVVTGWPPHRLTALGLGYVPQVDNVFPRLSVRENLQLGAVARPRGAGQRLTQVLDAFPDLGALLDRPAGSLSGGQRQALALARALMAEPSVLLLDEPFAGLAPEASAALLRHLRRLHQAGLSMLLVEQNARLALTMCDYGYVLEMGRNRYQGAGPELLSDPKVAELYLGRSPSPLSPDKRGRRPAAAPLDNPTHLPPSSPTRGRAPDQGGKR
jgi:branched-chain amino acid transport system ATP-binding protein